MNDVETWKDYYTLHENSQRERIIKAEDWENTI